jgi:hypothetical protein
LAIITFTTIKNKGKGKPSVYLKVNKKTKQNSTAQHKTIITWFRFSKSKAFEGDNPAKFLALVGKVAANILSINQLIHSAKKKNYNPISRITLFAPEQKIPEHQA